MHPYHISNSWRQDPETTKFFKNKVKFVDYRIKWNEYFEEKNTFW